MFLRDELHVSIKTSRPLNLEDIKVTRMNEIVIKHRTWAKGAEV
jgi:hypothetical protein